MKHLEKCSVFPFPLDARGRLRRMCFIWIFRLTLVYAVFSTTECCFKSTHSSSSSSSTSQPNSNGPGNTGQSSENAATTPAPAVNRLQCTDAEITSQECHNEGTCFAVKNAFKVRTLQCQCKEEWTGVKCEERNVRLILGGVQSAGVSNVVGLILGLCLGGILLIVVGFVIGWFGRGKREATKKQQQFAEAPSTEDVHPSNGNGPVPSSNGRTLQQANRNSFSPLQGIPETEPMSRNSNSYKPLRPSPDPVENGNSYKPVQFPPETPPDYGYDHSMDISEESSLAGQPDTQGATRGYQYTSTRR